MFKEMFINGTPLLEGDKNKEEAFILAYYGNYNRDDRISISRDSMVNNNVGDLLDSDYSNIKNRSGKYASSYVKNKKVYAYYWASKQDFKDDVREGPFELSIKAYNKLLSSKDLNSSSDYAKGTIISMEGTQLSPIIKMEVEGHKIFAYFKNNGVYTQKMERGPKTGIDLMIKYLKNSGFKVPVRIEAEIKDQYPEYFDNNGEKLRSELRKLKAKDENVSNSSVNNPRGSAVKETKVTEYDVKELLKTFTAEDIRTEAYTVFRPGNNGSITVKRNKLYVETNYTTWYD